MPMVLNQPAVGSDLWRGRTCWFDATGRFPWVGFDATGVFSLCMDVLGVYSGDTPQGFDLPDVRPSQGVALGV